MQYEPDATPRFNQRNLILLALFGIALLMALLAGFEDGRFDWRGFVGNLSTELIGAVITFWIIDRIINTRQNQQQLKMRLIREMNNRNNAVTSRAVAELRSNGWLADGALHGWFFSDANLEGLYLRDANLNGLGLYRCTLKDARIDEHQLLHMHDLRRTIMPDGQVYDGRFCLNGDLVWAQTKYSIDPRTADFAVMADYYDVTLEQYLEGQRWALQHIPDRVPRRDLPPHSS